MIPPTPSRTYQLDSVHIGRQVLYFDELDSTNTAAAVLATQYEPGLVVIAGHQTAGRGQFGRVWQARPGSSLLLSVALQPPRELCRPVILTALAAVALSEAVLALTGAQSRIKWPNDLLVRGKKVCGILIENTTATVIGIGLNLNQTASEFEGAGLPGATSLGLLTERPVPPDAAAEIVLRKLDMEYDRLLRGERVGVEADWKWRVGLLGRQVAMELTDGSVITGRLREMSFDGLELDVMGYGPRTLVPETIRHITPESL